MIYKANRNAQIDGLRSVAMIAVLVHHFFYSFCNRFNYPVPINSILIQESGYFGVGIFLLISGYYVRKDNCKFSKFIVKKLTRLWPEYFVAISACFIVTHIIVLPGRTVDIWEYLLNIPFLNGYVGVRYVDSGHWYLTTLISCIIISQTIIRINNQRYFYGMVFAWLFLILILCSFTTANKYLAMVCHGLLNVLGGVYSPIFIAGFILGKQQSNRKKQDGTEFEKNTTRVNNLNDEQLFSNKIIRIRKIEHQQLTGSIQVVDLIIFVSSLLVIFYLMGWKRGLVSLICVVLVYLSANNHLSFLQNRFLLSLSVISYPTYVIHSNIGYWLLLRMINLMGYYTPFMSLCLCAFSPVLGFVVYRVVNKPKKIISYYTSK